MAGEGGCSCFRRTDLVFLEPLPVVVKSMLLVDGR